jgi:hypothetical protein
MLILDGGTIFNRPPSSLCAFMINSLFLITCSWLFHVCFSENFVKCFWFTVKSFVSLTFFQGSYVEGLTHVVVPPSMAHRCVDQKQILGCLASGKKIVTLDYLYACRQENTFVDEVFGILNPYNVDITIVINVRLWVVLNLILKGMQEVCIKLFCLDKLFRLKIELCHL